MTSSRAPKATRSDTIVDVGGGVAYFAAVDAIGRRGLYRTDGTEAGTVQFANLSVGRPQPRRRRRRGTAYFTEGGAGSRFLWKTDGTRAGTSQQMAVTDGIAAGRFAMLGGAPYFAATHLSFGNELWTLATQARPRRHCPKARDAGAVPGTACVTWIDNATDESGYRVERLLITGSTTTLQPHVLRGSRGDGGVRRRADARRDLRLPRRQATTRRARGAAARHVTDVHRWSPAGTAVATGVSWSDPLNWSQDTAPGGRRRDGRRRGRAGDDERHRLGPRHDRHRRRSPRRSRPAQA